MDNIHKAQDSRTDNTAGNAGIIACFIAGISIVFDQEGLFQNLIVCNKIFKGNK